MQEPVAKTASLAFLLATLPVGYTVLALGVKMEVGVAGGC